MSVVVESSEDEVLTALDSDTQNNMMRMQ